MKCKLCNKKIHISDKYGWLHSDSNPRHRAVPADKMNTESIIESLNHAAIRKQGIPNEVLHQVANALTERDELRAAVEWESSRVDALHLAQATDEETIQQLRAKYDDIMETYQNVIDEKCASDEKHCTCVPFLRMEIKRLRAAIDKNINNALTIANYIGDGLDYGEAQIVAEMAHNIVNELGEALNEVAE